MKQIPSRLTHARNVKAILKFPLKVSKQNSCNKIVKSFMSWVINLLKIKSHTSGNVFQTLTPAKKLFYAIQFLSFLPTVLIHLFFQLGDSSEQINCCYWAVCRSRSTRRESKLLINQILPNMSIELN